MQLDYAYKGFLTSMQKWVTRLVTNNENYRTYGPLCYSFPPSYVTILILINYSNS